MDIRRNPPPTKPRKTIGTPTRSFSRNISLALISLAAVIGIAHHYSPTAEFIKKLDKDGYFEKPKELAAQESFFMWSPFPGKETALEEVELRKEVQAKL